MKKKFEGQFEGKNVRIADSFKSKFETHRHNRIKRLISVWRIKRAWTYLEKSVYLNG